MNLTFSAITSTCACYQAQCLSLWCSPFWRIIVNTQNNGSNCAFRSDNIVVVQTQSCLTVWGPMDCSTASFLSFTISWSLLKLMSIESGMPSNHLVLCHPLLLPSICPSIRVFANESALCIKWPEYWSFSFSISPSNEYSGLISFRIDWLDLLAVQGTLKSLLQHHSSKTSILWRSAFFMVQLSHPYMTTWKTIALTRRTFASKVMCLLFNMLSGIVIAFLPRIKTDPKKVLNYWKLLLKLWLINNLDQRTWPSSCELFF